MTLYARIQNNSDQPGELEGWVVSITEVMDEGQLLTLVGPHSIGEFTLAPHGYCIGWRYSEGKFQNPEDDSVQRAGEE